MQDIRFALRTLLKNPGFTIIAVLALGIGIGANTAIFSVVSGVLLRPLPFPDSERLVRIWEAEKEFTGSVSGPNFDDLREGSKDSFEQMAAVSYTDVNLADGGDAERLVGMRVSPDFFPMLRVAPLAGRIFDAGEYRAGADNEVILSSKVWHDRFGGATNAIGRSVTLGGQPYTIIGVMPESTSYPMAQAQVWLPYAPPPATVESRGSHFLQVLGRLRPGVTVARASAELNTIMNRLALAYPDTNDGRMASIMSVHEALVGKLRPALLLLAGAVLLVLLIACANVANMLLARAASRQAEIAVRVALGASRLRLIRQLLTESLVLAIIGGGFGLLLASWGVDLIGASVTKGSVSAAALRAGIDGRVLAFAGLVSLASVLLFGLLPALRASRADLSDSLKDGGSRSMTSNKNKLRSLLVIGQVALSLALLVGAGLMTRSFQHVADMDPGFEPSGVVTAEISLPKPRYADDAKIIAFYRELLQRVRATPGVEHAGITDFLPLSQSNMNGDFTIEGVTFTKGEHPVTEYMYTSADYFAAMGMHLRAGRYFTDADDEHAPQVCIINETFARRWFPNQDPIGKHMRYGGESDDGAWREIVGVVGDVRRFGLDTDAAPETWAPYAQAPFASMAIVVRAKDSAAVAAMLRREVAAVDPEQAIYDVLPLPQIVATSLADRRLNAILIGVFAIVALVLAAIGIYGVMSYQVTQRTRELGIRMALGARQTEVQRMVVMGGLKLTLAGVAVGLVAAALLSRLMAGLLFGVTPLDPLTYGVVAAALTSVALVASYLPARRATRIDPMIALRA